MNHLDIEDLLEDADSGSDHEEIAGGSHDKLIDKVKALYGSREVRQRAEPSYSVSEFGFTRDGGLTAYDMLKDLNNTEDLRKKRNKVLKLKQKAAALPVPLPKVSRERLQRAISYAKTSDELKKWDSIVEHHESADQIRFPLNDEKIRVENGAEFAKKFKPSTKLEEQVEALLSTSKHRLDSDAALTQFEEEKLTAMTKEEAVIRLSELRKLRSLMHSEALKNRRMRKIKSRKFHRAQRRDKMKQAIRDFEQLKVTNPQMALEKLEELERIRREERVSLRHKTKNRWAIQVAKKGKFDKEAQESLRERIELGRELEAKVKMDDREPDDDDEAQDGIGDGIGEVGGHGSSEEERDVLEKSLHEEEEQDHQENPWLRRTFFEEVKARVEVPQRLNETKEVATTESEDPPATILRVPEHLKRKSSEKLKRQSEAEKVSKKESRKPEEKPEIVSGGDESSDSSDEEEEDIIQESTAILDPYAKVDLDVIEGRIDEAKSEQKALKRKLDIETPKSAVCIDPEKVLTVGKVRKLKSQFRTTVGGEDDDEDGDDAEEMDVDKQRRLIQEAFAGDDVVQDFIKEQKEKNAEERAADREAALKKKGLDGDWVTPGNIHRLDNRRSHFLKHRKAFKPQAAIVHDDANSKAIRDLKVVDVPKGFTSVSQFETVLKQPVGSAYNTPRAFSELTKKKIVTKMGKIIKPIDESALVKNVKSDLKPGRRRQHSK
ncbi:U3 small nucleolar RNA-associated protein 14 homolog A [Galendromus occidentalis]|uniref:U3 small nucleolar RNA-associated protein 14 homolog A n=1 Tax=Galendromus occidentalis TaxID=34638 RepID=A0AAJ6QYI0_9ACAR|nr:U3 small nucleolar RNA-associated protein 14 homolog A [Galendromus occidentalis]